MRKLILILLFPIWINAQQISVGFDVSNALYGSKVNKPSLDVQLKVYSVEKWGEIGLQVESFKEIDYFSWGVFANQSLHLEPFEFLVGVEGIQIIRNKIGILSYGFNGEIRYFWGNIGLGLQYNYRYRADLEIYDDGRFVKSGFINLIYKK